jgi:protein CWC15
VRRLLLIFGCRDLSVLTVKFAGICSSDDEDEEAELMRELEKIKQEREEERLRKEAEARKAVEEQSREEILQGNPLTQQQAAGSAKMKRRWNDDVVFKNQSRNEPEVKKRFINDTIRNDFHRRFLNKYIQ